MYVYGCNKVANIGTYNTYSVLDCFNNCSHSSLLEETDVFSLKGVSRKFLIVFIIRKLFKKATMARDTERWAINKKTSQHKLVEQYYLIVWMMLFPA